MFHILNDTEMFFYSGEVLKPLHENWQTLSTNVRRQMVDNIATATFLSASEGTNTFLIIVLVITFILSMVSGGALQGFLWYLRSLQLIIHLPLLQTTLPSNVSAFF